MWKPRISLSSTTHYNIVRFSNIYTSVNYIYIYIITLRTVVYYKLLINCRLRVFEFCYKYTNTIHIYLYLNKVLRLLLIRRQNQNKIIPTYPLQIIISLYIIAPYKEPILSTIYNFILSIIHI